MVPTKASLEQHGTAEVGDDLGDAGHRRTRSVMEDLVDQLAALDRSTSSVDSGSGSGLAWGRT